MVIQQPMEQRHLDMILGLSNQAIWPQQIFSGWCVSAKMELILT